MVFGVHAFPPHHEATPEGLLAVGSDLNPRRLLAAYQNGIFPWYEMPPIRWWSPPDRFVRSPEALKISKSMRKVLREKSFTITFNRDFKGVIKNCRLIARVEQRGTWITDEMESAYTELHQMGYAKSVEVWRDGELVGGLYGVQLGDIFCGERMFHRESNASKAGLIALVQTRAYRLIDCQPYTKHLEQLGARHIPRADSLSFLNPPSTPEERVQPTAAPHSKHPSNDTDLSGFC